MIDHTTASCYDEVHTAGCTPRQEVMSDLIPRSPGNITDLAAVRQAKKGDVPGIPSGGMKGALKDWFVHFMSGAEARSRVQPR
jgi:hypothetical protein